MLFRHHNQNCATTIAETSDGAPNFEDFLHSPPRPAVVDLLPSDSHITTFVPKGVGFRERWEERDRVLAIFVLAEVVHEGGV